MQLSRFKLTLILFALLSSAKTINAGQDLKQNKSILIKEKEKEKKITTK